MATSLLLMASTEATMPEASNNPSGCEGSRPDNPRSSRPRKTAKSSAPAQKKQPQRGMGVAQLERLRLQERWKKMTEITHLQPMNLSGHFHYQIPYQFTEPPPPQAGAPGQPGLVPPVWVPRFGSGGFHGFGGSGGLRVMDPCRSSGAMGTLMEASKELSSMPKMECCFDHCDLCFKKKKMNIDNLGFNRGRDRSADTPPYNSFDFLGLDLSNDHNPDFSPRPSMDAAYACHNPSEDVEVVAVHRKRNSVNGNVFMEYEFFPRKGETSTSTGGGGGEASLAIPTAAASDTTSRNASNVIDLSLKLSY